MGLFAKAAAAILLLLASLPAAAGQGSRPAPDIPTIAAASDLQFALRDLATAFRRSTGREVNVAFGSSGNLMRQIRAGAPFQMFLSADERFVEQLAAEGLTRGEGDLYAVGRIALVTPKGSTLKADGTLEDLKAALADGRLTRFAIANPEHAPYGKRAEEALRSAGLWEAIQGKLVLGETVSQAAQFAISGGADGGIVAYSLALAPNLSDRAHIALIPADRHEPLRQRMVLLQGAGETAELFYGFVRSQAGRAVLERHGFAVPDGTM